MAIFESTKVIELGSCAFRQPKAKSHCRFIHGYRLIAKFWFACNKLDENHWCMDFGALKNLKQMLENQFDHTTCIAADDPALPEFRALVAVGACDLRIMPNGTGIERISEMCFEIADKEVRKITDGRCWVTRVEVWEHEKNSAMYIEPLYVNNTQYNCKETSKPKPTEEEVDKYFQSLGEPVEEANEPQQTSNHPDPIPAPIGNPKSSGIGNPFDGTSWSAKYGDSLR